MLILAACSGGIPGVIRGSGEPVVIKYEQGMSVDMYTTVISGENFRGKAVMDGAQSFYGNSVGTNGFGQVFGSFGTGNFTAVMLGDKGNTIRCQMKYADSSGFTTSGGVGECIHSDGRIMDLIW